MTPSAMPSEKSLRRTVLTVSLLSSFLTPFMGSGFNVALPAVGNEFALNPVALSWIATSFLLAAAMFLLPFGRAADILGRKKIFAWGIGITTAGTVLCALSPSALFLIISRGIQGVGSAMMFGTGIAILTSVFPMGELGKVLGLSTAAVYTGLSLGPIVGGFLTHHWGWRSIFWVNVPLAAIAGALIWNIKGEWAEARGEALDWKGSLTFSAGLTSLMVGFSRLPSGYGLALTVLGLAILMVFVRLEMRVPSPILDMNLLRNNRIFAFSNLAAFINYSATAAVSFLLSLYLQYIKGLDPRQAGLVLIAQPIVMAVFSPIAGRLSDRIEPRLIASLGMGLTSVGLVLFVFLREGTSIPFIIGSLLCLGLGFGLFSSPNTNAVMGSVKKASYGVASASLGTMRLLGQMFSNGISMMFFAVIMGQTPISPPVYPLFLKSIRLLFIFYAAISAAGLFASLARGNRHSVERA